MRVGRRIGILNFISTWFLFALYLGVLTYMVMGNDRYEDLIRHCFYFHAVFDTFRTSIISIVIAPEGIFIYHCPVIII